MNEEQIKKRIEQLKSQKKLQPKEEWELKKLQKEIEKLANNDNIGVGIFVNENNYTDIQIEKIIPNPYQNRTIFDDDSIKELAQSIEEIGLIQPIVVAKNGDEYTLISGERRLRAYKLLNKPTIQAVLRYNISNIDLEEIALVENLAREDIGIYDETQAISKLHNRGLSYSQIATKIGKSKTYVARIMGISAIDTSLLQKVSQNNVYKPKLLEQIAKQPHEQQIKLVDKLIADDLSLKELEAKTASYKPQLTEYLCKGVVLKKNSKKILTIEINKKYFDKQKLLELIGEL